VSILDCVDIWVSSLRQLFEASGVVIDYRRTDDDRPDHSCALNLRRDDVEVDFLVWESGNGELAVLGLTETVTESHFDNLRDAGQLAAVLSRILNAMPPIRP
jgi:hypothetical protein